IPDWRIGAVIIKMMSSTRTTSTNGTMLISESEVCVDLESCGIFPDSMDAAGWDGSEILVKSFLDLRRDLQGKSVQALSEVANILQKLVVEDHRRDGGEKTRGSGDERFGDARRDGAQAGGTGAAQAGERVDDAPNGAEQTDEGRHGTGGGQPGHAFFDATDFVGGSELHADGDGLQTFQFGRVWIPRGTADLALQLAIARRIDRRKRGASRCQSLRVRYPPRGAKNAQELVTLAADASEEAKLLENHAPRDDGKHEKQEQNAAGDPASLRKNISDVGCKNRVEQKNNVPLSESKRFVTAMRSTFFWA